MSPLLSALTDWNSFMQASFVLIVISVMSSAITVVLWYLLLMEITQRFIASGIIALALACSHGFLLYAHSGTAYIPGLTCVTASLYFLRKNKIVAGALLYALSSLLWFPFVLAGAALFLVAVWPANRTIPLTESHPAIKLSKGFRFATISAVCILFVLCVALIAREVTSTKEAKEWYSEAQHGWSQNMGIIRVATGLPRSFLYLGYDGVLFKRYLEHDPYAPVTIADLVKASLWKIIAFDLFAICLIYELVNYKISRRPLLLFLLGTAPVVCFAVFIFEPGSPERYLPALPFVVLAVGLIFRDFPQKRRFTQIVTAAFLFSVVCNNISSFARPRINRKDGQSWARVSEVRQRVTGTSLVAVLTNHDEIEDFVSRSPFAEVNRPNSFVVYDVVEPATLRVLHWKEQFAARALQAWDRGGEVWISQRVWSIQPHPDWHWVEGDDRRVSWKEIPEFFSILQTDASTHTEDGFLRLTRNEANRVFLCCSPLPSRRTSPATVSIVPGSRRD
jgi:hypothetical protein